MMIVCFPGTGESEGLLTAVQNGGQYEGDTQSFTGTESYRQTYTHTYTNTDTHN